MELLLQLYKSRLQAAEIAGHGPAPLGWAKCPNLAGGKRLPNLYLSHEDLPNFNPSHEEM
jgi:hypothetical protein